MAFASFVVPGKTLAEIAKLLSDEPAGEGEPEKTASILSYSLCWASGILLAILAKKFSASSPSAKKSHSALTGITAKSRKPNRIASTVSRTRLSLTAASASRFKTICIYLPPAFPNSASL